MHQEIDAPASRVWEALTDPAQIKQYYFGTDLQTDWQVGSRMTFTGDWQGKPYEDLGTITAVEPNRRLAYSHWSPLSGTPDTPANRHQLEFILDERDGRTMVTLTQDNNPTGDARDHSAEMWSALLDDMKQVVERDGGK